MIAALENLLKNSLESLGTVVKVNLLSWSINNKDMFPFLYGDAMLIRDLKVKVEMQDDKSLDVTTYIDGIAHYNFKVDEISQCNQTVITQRETLLNSMEEQCKNKLQTLTKN